MGVISSSVGSEAKVLDGGLCVELHGQVDYGTKCEEERQGSACMNGK